MVPNLNMMCSRAKEGECGGQNYATGRYNENKVDLNRDFPTWWDIQRGTEEQ